MIRFDTILIGGGLSSLTCALFLAEQGQKCAVITAGENALLCSSGAFNLLNFKPDGTAVEHPADALATLGSRHPYSKIGADAFAQAAQQCEALLARTGVSMSGSYVRNHFRISPMGSVQPCWLTPESETVPFENENVAWRKAAIFDLSGFLDFAPAFLKDGLEKRGCSCNIFKATIPVIAQRRMSSSEMRAVNLARLFENDKNTVELAKLIKSCISDEDTVILPSIFGYRTEEAIQKISGLVGRPVCMLPTLPPSVTGHRIAEQMLSRLRGIGCTIIFGDKVTRGIFEGGELQAVYTEKHQEIRLEAENFVLASGDFFSNGLSATSDYATETALGVDVAMPEDFDGWCVRDMFAPQPHQRCGVATDESFHAMLGGKVVPNLYAAGAILEGCDSLRLGCGAGVAMLTAKVVADNILGGKQS